MKNKVARLLLISVFILAIAVPIAEQSFLVRASYSQPSVTRLDEWMNGDLSTTTVSGTFKNNEKFDVSGVAVATLQTGPNYTPLKQSSVTTTIPANSQTDINVVFNVPYENSFAITINFVANPVTNPNGGSGTQSTSPSNGEGGTRSNTGTSTGGFNSGSLVVPLIVVGAVVVGGMGGLFMFRRTRVSEEKVKRFTSYDYQNWVMQRLRAQPSSVLESRKGIDGFTSDHVPLAIKQSDNIGRLQVDSFINALVQAKARQGAMVAFNFDTDARAAVTRARMNRMDIKLVTVKELIDRKDMALA